VLAVQNTAADAGDAVTEKRYRIVDYCGDVHLYPPET
jgi:lysine 2,3-aminomutase